MLKGLHDSFFLEGSRQVPHLKVTGPHALPHGLPEGRQVKLGLFEPQTGKHDSPQGAHFEGFLQHGGFFSGLTVDCAQAPSSSLISTLSNNCEFRLMMFQQIRTMLTAIAIERVKYLNESFLDCVIT